MIKFSKNIKLKVTSTLFSFQRSFTVSFNRKELAEALGMDEQVLKPFNSILKATRDNDVDAIKNRMTDNFVDEYDSFKNDFKDYLNHFVKKFESDFEDDDDSYPLNDNPTPESNTEEPGVPQFADTTIIVYE